MTIPWLRRSGRAILTYGLAGLVATLGCGPRASTATAPAARPAQSLHAVDAAWVDRTLRSLTLRQKLGQMVMPWVDADYAAADSPELDSLLAMVQRDGVGGVVMSVGMPLSYAVKLNELQRRARVPLLVASDMEIGPGMRMAGIYSFPHLLPQGGATNFPPAMALGATGSDSLAYAVGAVLASEARAVGVHMTFGPVLDVNSNPANPIINTRSFGEDAAAVTRLASSFARGAHAGGLLTTGKHFPGHGDTDVDSHLDLPSLPVTRARLDSLELSPYRAMLASALDGVMSAHIAVTGIEGADAPPATLSHYFLTDVLRNDLGFKGIVVTDAMNMGAVVRRYGAGEATVKAVQAGADVVLMPLSIPATLDTLESAVRGGRISEARIDSSVRRILAAKTRVGLQHARQVDVASVPWIVGNRAHLELASRVAERSIVLARDSARLVPLAPATQRVLVVVYAAPNDPISGAAFARALRRPGLRVDLARMDVRTTAEELAAIQTRADSADIVVAAAYVAPFEGSGTIGTAGRFAGLVQARAAAGKPTIAVSFGSPYLLSSFPGVSAYLLAWGNADASQTAAARALLGLAPITGTLPVTIPPYARRGDGLLREVVPQR